MGGVHWLLAVGLLGCAEGTTLFHAEHVGGVTAMVALPGGEVALIGPRGFGRVDASGHLLFSVHEDLAAFAVRGTELTAATQNGGKLLVFDLLQGAMLREVAVGAEPILSMAAHNAGVFAVTSSAMFRVDEPQTRRAFESAQGLQASVVGNRLRVLTREGSSFCRYFVEEDMQGEAEKECRDEPWTLDQSYGPEGCHSDTRSDAEVCITPGQAILTLRTQSRVVNLTDAILAAEGVAHFTLDPIFDCLFVLTERMTLIAFSLSTGRARYTREESLGEVVASALWPRQPSADNSFEQYEAILRSRGWPAAWRYRAGIQAARLMNLGQKWNFADPGRILAPPESNRLAAARKLLLVTRAGKVHLLDLERQSFAATALFPLRRIESAAISFEKGNFVVTVGHRRFSVAADLKIERLTDSPPPLSRCTFAADRIDRREAEIPVWAMQFGREETIQLVIMPAADAVPQSPHVIEGGHVLFKVSDVNNALVVTKGTEAHGVYLVNLATGAVLATFANGSILGEVKGVADDNAFFLSYTHKESLETEIWVLELFHRRAETSFEQTLRRFLGPRERVLPPPQYHAHPQPLVIAQRKYGLSLPVAKLGVFTSPAGYAARNVLAVTPNADIYSLPRQLLSGRRMPADGLPAREAALAKGPEPDWLVQSPSLPPYDYELAVDPRMSVNKETKLRHVDHLSAHHTHFESTAFVVAAGQSLFVGLTAPDRAFDQLPANFNKPALLLALLGCAAALLGSELVLRRRAPLLRFKAIA